MKATTMRLIPFLAAAVLSVTSAISSALAQENFDEARKMWPDLRILSPEKIPGLGSAIKADLSNRSCRIPMFTKWDGRHNVIRGSFHKPGNKDIAVLCFAGDDMSIIIYADGNAGVAEEIRKFPADALRMIHTVSPFVLNKRAIRDKAVERLPKFDHDAIDDGPVGASAETRYYHDGAWIDVF